MLVSPKDASAVSLGIMYFTRHSLSRGGAPLHGHVRAAPKVMGDAGGGVVHWEGLQCTDLRMS